MPKASKPFACTEEGFDATFKTQNALNGRWGTSHKKWTPRTCDKTYVGCDPFRVFNTKKEWFAHVKKDHTSFVPMRCVVPGGQNERVWQNVDALSQHLSIGHKLRKEEKKVFLTTEPVLECIHGLCPVPGCSFHTVITTFSKLRRHLEKKQHGLSTAEVEHYISIRSRQVRLS